MIVKVANLEVDGSVTILVKDPEQLVQVLLSSSSLLTTIIINTISPTIFIIISIIIITLSLIF